MSDFCMSVNCFEVCRIMTLESAGHLMKKSELVFLMRVFGISYSFLSVCFVELLVFSAYWLM